jgi:predicted nucleic acid-binding protein
MTRFVLDTDIVSLLQRGHPKVIGHIAEHNPREIATTIITVEEQVSSWYTLLRRGKTSQVGLNPNSVPLFFFTPKALQPRAQGQRTT